MQPDLSSWLYRMKGVFNEGYVRVCIRVIRLPKSGCPCRRRNICADLATSRYARSTFVTRVPKEDDTLPSRAMFPLPTALSCR